MTKRWKGLVSTALYIQWIDFQHLVCFQTLSIDWVRCQRSQRRIRYKTGLNTDFRPMDRTSGTKSSTTMTSIVGKPRVLTTVFSPRYPPQLPTTLVPATSRLFQARPASPNSQTFRCHPPMLRTLFPRVKSFNRTLILPQQLRRRIHWIVDHRLIMMDPL